MYTSITKMMSFDFAISDNYETPAVFGRHGRKIKAPSWKKDYYSPSTTKRTHTTDEAEMPSKKRDYESLFRYSNIQ